MSKSKPLLKSNLGLVFVLINLWLGASTIADDPGLVTIVGGGYLVYYLFTFLVSIFYFPIRLVSFLFGSFVTISNDVFIILLLLNTCFWYFVGYYMQVGIKRTLEASKNRKS